jgi:parvulin-like peptidyl-prolyl isomerase
MFGAKRVAIIVVSLALTIVFAAAPSGLADSDPAQLMPDDIALVGGRHATVAEYQRRLKVLKKESMRPLSGKQLAEVKRDLVHAYLTDLEYEQEAAQLGLVVTKRSVEKQFGRQWLPLFRSKRDYRKYLKNTAQTTADLHQLVRNQLLRDEVETSWWSMVGDVTDQQLLDEYNGHPADYEAEENRDLRLIFTSHRARATKALAALRNGRGFASVARKFTEDATGKRHGGFSPHVSEGQFQPALGKAIFRAKLGEIVGPVRLKDGFFIFKVTRIRPAALLPFEDVKPYVEFNAVDRLSEAQSEDKLNEFTARWKSATVCRAKYTIDLCGSTLP